MNISPMRPDQAYDTYQLIKTGFADFVRPDLTDEGEREFFNAVDMMIHKRPDNHFILVALIEESVVGVIDVRDNNHVCLFFVDQNHHRSGIGGRLFKAALDECRASNPEFTEIDVNSSLYAVEAYKRLGFKQTKPEQMINGIRFVPMIYEFPN